MILRRTTAQRRHGMTSLREKPPEFMGEYVQGRKLRLWTTGEFPAFTEDESLAFFLFI